MKDATRDTLIVLGILGAMVASTMIFVFAPQGRRHQELKVRIATKKASLEADALRAQVVPQMLRKVEEMKSRYNDLWEKKLPRRIDLGAFLRDISQNLEREDLAGKLIEPGNPQKQEFYNTLPILMRFQGSFAALSNFLDRLDRMERLTRIQKVQIIADNKQTPAMLDVQLKLNIYFIDTESMQG